jgi:hypothetical protein
MSFLVPAVRDTDHILRQIAAFLASTTRAEKMAQSH